VISVKAAAGGSGDATSAHLYEAKGGHCCGGSTATSQEGLPRCPIHRNPGGCQDRCIAMGHAVLNNSACAIRRETQPVQGRKRVGTPLLGTDQSLARGKSPGHGRNRQLVLSPGAGGSTIVTTGPWRASGSRKFLDHCQRGAATGRTKGEALRAGRTTSSDRHGHMNKPLQLARNPHQGNQLPQRKVPVRP